MTKVEITQFELISEQTIDKEFVSFNLITSNFFAKFPQKGIRTFEIRALHPISCNELKLKISSPLLQKIQFQQKDGSIAHRQFNPVYHRTVELQSSLLSTKGHKRTIYCEFQIQNKTYALLDISEEELFNLVLLNWQWVVRYSIQDSWTAIFTKLFSCTTLPMKDSLA